ncbi:MAG: hypothetical protein IKS74_06850 [Methanomicrobium sp.]|nr:hypothetical protein [Methanomicrobium sp.]
MGALRSVSSVILTVIALMITLYVGSIVFYSVYGALDPSNLSGAWLTYYNAIYQLFGMGIQTIMFLFVLCIFAPLLWIYLGNAEEEDGDRI